MKSLHLTLVLIFGVTMVHAELNNGQPERSDPEREAMAGMDLTAEEAGDLEALVAKKPDDLSSRTKLLGYYFSSQYNTDDSQTPRKKHILWIINNHPEAVIAGRPFCSIDAILDGDSYREAKELWLKQTQAQSKNSAVLGNAANYFLLHDRDLAEKLLKQAQQLEPNDPQGADQLGHLYSLQKSKETATKSLAEYERAQGADALKESRFYRLDSLANAALKAGEIKKASNYAEEMLKASKGFPNDWNYGNAIHHGNNVLGRIALKKGDIKLAAEYLLKAGLTPGSPQLNSFGPNMSLAKELLEAGEKDSVLQYFEFCRKFGRWAARTSIFGRQR